VVKLHQTLIGVALVGLVGMFFLQFAGDTLTQHNVDGMNTNKTQFINESYQNLDDTVKETQQQLEILEGNPNFLDVVGAFFAGAFGALKTLASSFGVFIKLLIGGIGILPIGGMSDLVVGSISLILIIVIFVGVIMKTLLGGTGENI
jgi:hypothetical protein